MKRRITEDKEYKAKRVNEVHFSNKGLLNSVYKRTVTHNFKKTCKKSLFGVRQRFKSPKLCKTSHATSMGLKISVFACFALAACV